MAYQSFCVIQYQTYPFGIRRFMYFPMAIELAYFMVAVQLYIQEEFPQIIEWVKRFNIFVTSSKIRELWRFFSRSWRWWTMLAYKVQCLPITLRVQPHPRIYFSGLEYVLGIHGYRTTWPFVCVNVMCVSASLYEGENTFMRQMHMRLLINFHLLAEAEITLLINLCKQ